MVHYIQSKVDQVSDQVHASRLIYALVFFGDIQALLYMIRIGFSFSKAAETPLEEAQTIPASTSILGLEPQLDPILC